MRIIRIRLILGKDKRKITNKPYQYLVEIENMNGLEEVKVFEKKELLDYLKEKIK